jgi:hypothetical protein
MTAKHHNKLARPYRPYLLSFECESGEENGYSFNGNGGARWGRRDGPLWCSVAAAISRHRAGRTPASKEMMNMTTPCRHDDWMADDALEPLQTEVLEFLQGLVRRGECPACIGHALAYGAREIGSEAAIREHFNVFDYVDWLYETKWAPATRNDEEMAKREE